ncbi:MAG: HmuY family protein [Gemmatimonadota bacterium]
MAAPEGLLGALLGRFGRGPVAVVGGSVLLAVFLVGLTLHDPPSVATYPVSPARPAAADSTLVGPVVHTVDATAEGTWVRFDFSRGAVVPPDDPLGWDIAFRRFAILVNGGPGYPGAGGAVDLGEVPFDAVDQAPAAGYQGSVTHPDSANPALDRWYEYGWSTHLLTPRPRVYAVRTADGRYAKVQVLGYYCPGPRPGCLTFRYVYQGSGGRHFTRPSTAASPPDSTVH